MKQRPFKLPSYLASSEGERSSRALFTFSSFVRVSPQSTTSLARSLSESAALLTSVMDYHKVGNVDKGIKNGHVNYGVFRAPSCVAHHRHFKKLAWSLDTHTHIDLLPDTSPKFSSGLRRLSKQVTGEFYQDEMCQAAAGSFTNNHPLRPVGSKRCCIVYRLWNMCFCIDSDVNCKFFGHSEERHPNIHTR